MGIRYYGWAITSQEVEDARVDLWPVIHRADDRHDTPGWANTDLDKAWRPLQDLFSDPRHQQTFTPRPALELVAGEVTYPRGYEYGYLPHAVALAADRVREIATDLALVTRFDVRAYSLSWHRTHDEDYVLCHLKRAQAFALDAASRGHGVVYMIR